MEIHWQAVALSAGIAIVVGVLLGSTYGIQVAVGAFIGLVGSGWWLHRQRRTPPPPAGAEGD